MQRQSDRSWRVTVVKRIHRYLFYSRPVNADHNGDRTCNELNTVNYDRYWDRVVSHCDTAPYFDDHSSYFPDTVRRGANASLTLLSGNEVFLHAQRTLRYFMDTRDKVLIEKIPYFVIQDIICRYINRRIDEETL